MSYFELISLAVALALDAFAVAIATGVQLKCVSSLQTVRMSLAFGGFQAIMPLLGWLLGISVKHHIESFDHWVAFVLLGIVGARMIHESLGQDDETECTLDNTCGTRLLMLSIATSIDALAVGLSLAVIDIEIWMPAIVIGLVCFAFTAVGLHLGKLLGNIESIGRKAGIVGGVVLIAIGVNILYDHGVF